MPNTVGVTNVASTEFAFGSTWNPGSNLFLRWIDDNAVDPSPDEIIGIDNVHVAGVPEPSTLLLAGLAALGATGLTCRR